MSIFSRVKIVNSCPNAVKWLHLLCNFHKFSGGSMPPDPPREVPPSAVALSVPERNPTFSQNLNGSTEFHAKIHEIKKKKARKGSLWGEYTVCLIKV